MIDQPSRTFSLPLVAGALAVAAAFGFGVATLVNKDRPSPPAARAAAAPEAAPPVANAALAEVSIPTEYLAAAKIAVEPVGTGGIQAEILTAGTVTAQPNSEAQVVARAAGNITRIHRQLGDKVRAGDVLAQVESQEAAGMVAERSVAIARSELARKTFERESSLFKQGITPRQEMEAAQAAVSVANSEVQRAAAIAKAAKVSSDGKSIAVVSPIDGKVSGASITLGGYVQPQTELFRVAGNGPAQVEASVSAADIRRVAAGDKATILAANGQPVAAEVRSVTPTVSGASRSATVMLSPVSGATPLVVGEGVQVRLHTKQAGAGMVVPDDAVQNIDGRDVLFVRSKDGFRAQPVLVGQRSGGMAQIISGVRGGELVATRNAFLIKADMIKNAGDE